MNPIPVWVRKLWNAWDIRVVILLSFILQVTLLILGNRRKYSASKWISLVVWIAYLMADWVATAALGNLTQAQVDSTINVVHPNNEVIKALWAPLLLLHLGGPGTITAYAFEDNSLWLRHLAGIIVQLVLAIYVVLLSWTTSWLSFLTVPLLLAGVIKNGERVWILRLAGSRLISGNIPHSESWKAENLDYSRDADNLILGNLSHSRFWLFKLAVFYFFSAKVRFNNNMLTGLGPVHEKLWRESRQLKFVEEAIFSSMQGIKTIEMFDIIEIELGYLFDVLYTKAFLTYTWLGCILGCISSFCSFSALLIIFLVVFVEEKSCHCYSNVDTSITIVLLVGAVVLEFYGIILLRSSNWPVRLRQNWLPREIFRRLPRLFEKHKKKRWSRSLGQYSLLDSCFNHRTGKLRGLLERRLGIDEILLDRFQHNRFVEVPISLKLAIVNLFAGTTSSINSSRGRTALEHHHCYSGELKWSIQLSEFPESILTWHLATDICYHLSDPKTGSSDEEMETSKILSDYMMYLLLMHPSMFLSAAQQEKLDGRLTEQRSTLITRLKRGRPATNLREGCASLRSSELRLAEERLDGEGLAEELINREDKWKVMQSVWAEMLCYAAIHSEKVYHLRELGRGGQFLTHLWLFLLRGQLAGMPSRLFY